MISRRTRIAAATVLVALAAVGVLALRDLREDRAVDTLSVHGEGRSAPAPSLTPAPSPSPSPSAKPPAPQRAALPPPPANQSSDDTAFGPAPGAVSFAYQPGRSTWSAVSNGIRITVHITPTVPKAGEPVRFDITASAASGNCCSISMIYGDGFQSPQSDCVATGASAQQSFQHIYNRSGRKRFAAGAAHGGCASGGSIFASLDVAAGQSTAQGPALPVVHVDTANRPAGHEDDTSYVTIAGDATDEDGYVNWFVLEWGDGTKATYHNGDPCQRSMDGWPTPSWGTLPGEPDPPTHHYAKAGTFRVTLTAYSTSCDGADVQHASAHLDWSWAPPETALPSP